MDQTQFSLLYVNWPAQKTLESIFIPFPIIYNLTIKTFKKFYSSKFC